MTEDVVKDDYGYVYPSGSSILQGHYLDFISETRDFKQIYMELKKVAIISPSVVAGLCPPLQGGEIKHRGRMVDVLYVDDGLNEGLKDLCSGNVF